VPVVDPVIITYDEGTEKERDAFDMIGAYAYGAVATGGDAEAMRVDMYAPGVGTMANFHSTLFNCKDVCLCLFLFFVFLYRVDYTFSNVLSDK